MTAYLLIAALPIYPTVSLLTDLVRKDSFGNDYVCVCTSGFILAFA